MPQIDFGILGPVRVWIEGAELPIGGRVPQALLAVMLLEANRVVSVDTLIDAAWGSTPPASARTQVRNRVAKLRRLFRDAGADGDRPRTDGSGYVLRVDDGTLDADAFECEVCRAGRLSAAGDRDGAADALKAALSLWRGPALDGLDTPLLTAAAHRLNLRRGDALGQRADLDIAAGKYDLAIPDLVDLVTAQPWHERPVGRLMLALYLAGRKPEALRRFREVRQRLVADLGLDPGPELLELHDRIMRDDPTLWPAPVDDGPECNGAAARGVDAARPTPRTLPPVMPDFVGRTEVVAAITQWWRSSPDGAVTVISGLPGVGKTSLAIRTAHRLGEQCDGPHLFVDLGGLERPIDPAEALYQVLRDLGVDAGDIPQSLPARSTLFRSITSLRTCLLVLDNAAAAAQVRPLLPGVRALVLVTSRRALVDVDGAHHLRLEPFTVVEAVELLTAVAGAHRIAAEPAVAAAIVGYCGLLPLAVRVCGARIALRPHVDLAKTAADLVDAERRLDHLIRPDRSVRAALTSAYAALSDPARCLLRRIALLDLRDAPSWLAAAVLTGVPLDARHTDVDDVLAELAEANLVDVVGPDAADQHRFRLHDLVKAFGRERVEAEESSTSRDKVLAEVFASWLTIGEQADTALRRNESFLGLALGADLPRAPALTQRHVRDPHTWFRAERRALISTVGQAAATEGGEAYVWTLAWCLETFLRLEHQLPDLERVCRLGLAAAERMSRPDAVAAMRLGLAFTQFLHEDLDGTLEHLRHAKRAAELANEVWLSAEILGVESQVRVALGEATRARTLLDECIKLYEAAGDHVAVGVKLTAAGELADQQDDPAAATLIERGVERLREAGAGHALAHGLRRLARMYDRANDVDRARSTYLECLALVRHHRDRVGEAILLGELGAVLAKFGRTAEAAPHVAAAVATAEVAGAPMALAYTRYLRGSWRMHDGDPAGARDEIAPEIDELSSNLNLQLRALCDLGEAHRLLGDVGAARRTWERALSIAERIGAGTARRELTDRIAPPAGNR